MANTIVGFDVGNSSVKAGWFSERSVEAVRSVRHQSRETIETFLDEVLSEKPFGKAVIATVHDAVSDLVSQSLRDRKIDLVHVYRSDGSLFDQRHIGCAVDTPRSTGVDRVLASIAALQANPGRDAIVVTCGTAITVNLATADRVFRGGAILPGLELMARSLHEGTAALPQIPFAPSDDWKGDAAGYLPPSMPGRSTVSAMQAGVYFAAVGGIDRLVADLVRSVPGAVVSITGGDSAMIARGLTCAAVHSPCLVLDGLRIVTMANQA